MRRLAVPAVVLLATAVLVALRPGLAETAVRSPRAWLVALGVLLASRLGKALLLRTTRRPRVAVTGQLLVVGVVLVALVAPSFRQRTVVEAFPTVVTPPPVARASSEPVAVVVPSPVAVVAAAPAPPPPDPSPAPPSRPPAPPPPPPAAGPVLLSSGSLTGIRHDASGRTAAYELDGAQVLRFEDVDVEGTPGPEVHLVPLGDRDPSRGRRLGPLTAERGSFGYALPPDLDVRDGWTVLVWCRSYDTPIAVADLAR